MSSMTEPKCCLECATPLSDSEAPCPRCKLEEGRLIWNVAGTRVERPQGYLHLLEQPGSGPSLCGLNPAPFPLACADLGSLPEDVSEALREHKRSELLDPSTCPDCVDAYYRHPNARP